MGAPFGNTNASKGGAKGVRGKSGPGSKIYGRTLRTLASGNNGKTKLTNRARKIGSKLHYGEKYKRAASAIRHFGTKNKSRLGRNK